MTPDTNFSLRPAGQSDQGAIRALIHEAGINPTGLDWRRFVLAVDAQGEMIGCGQVKPQGDGALELASIAVRPAWRRQGVARAVIMRLIETHPGALYLTCRARLGPFYEQFGFDRVVEPAGMPPYFRRLTRLASLASQLHFMGEQLWVMRRDGDR